MEGASSTPQCEGSLCQSKPRSGRRFPTVLMSTISGPEKGKFALLRRKLKKTSQNNKQLFPPHNKEPAKSKKYFSATQTVQSSKTRHSTLGQESTLHLVLRLRGGHCQVPCGSLGARKRAGSEARFAVWQGPGDTQLGSGGLHPAYFFLEALILRLKD